MSIRSIMKKSKLIVCIYENYKAIECYIKARNNAIRLKKELTEQDRKKIQRFKNIHKGKRCFIIGTGPSQNARDLNRLKNEITITVNDAYISYDSTEWRADYYVVMDDSSEYVLNNLFSLEYEHKGVFYNGRLHYRGENGVKLACDAAHTMLMHTVWNKWFPRIFPIMRFSDDVSKVIYTGKTVVFSCIQIAAYMGFEEIYLSGIDCDYHGMLYSSIMGGNDAENIVTTQVKDMRTHLEKSGGLMIEQFEALNKLLQKNGIKVFNATRGGKLEVFPRVDLDSLLGKNAK